MPSFSKEIAYGIMHHAAIEQVQSIDAGTSQHYSAGSQVWVSKLCSLYSSFCAASLLLDYK